jgi:hypothetical protein
MRRCVVHWWNEFVGRSRALCSHSRFAADGRRVKQARGLSVLVGRGGVYDDVRGDRRWDEGLCDVPGVVHSELVKRKGTAHFVCLSFSQSVSLSHYLFYLRIALS